MWKSIGRILPSLTMRWENVWGRRALAGRRGRRVPACPRRGGLRLLLSRRRVLRAARPRRPCPRTRRSFHPALRRVRRPRPPKDTFPEATMFRFVAPRARRLRRRLLVKRLGRRRRKVLGQRKRSRASQLLLSVGQSGELVRSVVPPWRTTLRRAPSVGRTSLSLVARKRALGLVKRGLNRARILNRPRRARRPLRRLAPLEAQPRRRTAPKARRRGQADPRRRQRPVFRLMVRVRARERP